MTPAERAACEHALRDAERTAETLRAMLAAEPAPQGNELVPLTRAAKAWGISKDTALKRAKRGMGEKIAGRWFIPRAALHAGS